jgi:DNA-binding transcriptional LysR family regulator
VDDLMEMQQVRYFISLAKTLNFTRAAEECHVSQPSLTRAIRLLEAELGGDLVRRERRQSHLTELGQRMLPLLQQCYESALSAKKLATAMKKSEVAPLSIAVSQTINIAMFMPQLNELSRAYKGIQLKIRRGDLAEIDRLMRDGEVEIAIAGRMEEPWERLDQWPLGEERFGLVLHREHSLAAKEKIVIGDLEGERFLRRTGCEVNDEISGLLADHHAETPDAHEVESHHDLQALLEANFGIAFAPTSGFTSERLVRRQVDSIDVVRQITLYGIAGRRRSPAASTLLNLLRAHDWSETIR